VTHDQEEALSLADDIFLFDRGRVVQSGGPRDLYFHPRTRFAAEFLGKANLIAVRFGENGVVAARDVDGLTLVTLHSPPEAMRDPWAMVRPEAWRIVDDGRAALHATVEDATFIGDRLVVRAATALGTQTLSTEGFHALRPGDRIGLALAPDRLQLIDMSQS